MLRMKQINIVLTLHLSTVTLKRIDLTGNQISEIEDGAFSKLTLLEDLNLSENRLVKLPMLPATLTYFNANNNHLKTSGVKANAFKVHNFTITLHVKVHLILYDPIVDCLQKWEKKYYSQHNKTSLNYLDKCRKCFTIYCICKTKMK